MQALVKPKLQVLIENDEKKEDWANPINLKTIHLKNFAEKFDGREIPEDSPFVRVICDGGKEFVIKKTSVCWLLRQEHAKLSSDRLLRMKATCKQKKNKKQIRSTKY